MLGKVLEVIIGMSFLYFLLASVAAGIQEVIAGVFTWRGSYLSKAIDVLLDDSQTDGFKWTLSDFWTAHFSTKAPPTSVAAKTQAFGPNPTPGQQKLLEVLNIQQHPLLQGSPTGVPSYIPARNFAAAMLETLRDGSRSPWMAQVSNTVGTLPDGALKKTLQMFILRSGANIDKLHAEIETWFDDSMDRLNGIYRRLSQYVMLILGLLIAVTLNVDTFGAANMLWKEDALRNALVAEAGQVKPVAVTVAAPTKDQVQTALTNLKSAMSNAEDAKLPIGWDYTGCDQETWGKRVVCAIGNQGEYSPLGWLATALAIALGGPFWFSLLQQLTNIRNAGPKPAKPNPP